MSLSTSFFAHTGGHLLEEHLQKVAALAGAFAESFHATQWAHCAGLWHDLGKYRPGFQRYLAINEDAAIETRAIQTVGGREKTHSAAGALWAIEKFNPSKPLPYALPYGRILAYLIAGHHAGLDDWNGGLCERLQKEDSKKELQEALDAHPPAAILAHGDFVPDLRAILGGMGGIAFSLWVRMLFSCLIDADRLDTEAHCNADKSEKRAGFPSLATMQQAFDASMWDKTASATATPVNQLRADILRQCREKSSLPAGFFSLTVPTGGGKTLSSLAFALKHAQIHQKRRVIYAIPYTSIIEQTADVFRDIFQSLGDEVLIEHHSQADASEKDETKRSVLACENWDAPLIVTTNVQLFESLFSNKTSRCRKLHNIVNSVIVLDEAQQLPPAFLQPILDTLNLLVKHYGVTVVLCTATQPALNSTHYFDKTKNLRGLENVREIMENPDALFTALERVQVELPDLKTPSTWEEIADNIAQEECVLTIVGTRKAARDLHKLLLKNEKVDKNTIHLSALMCAAHRKTVIETIKNRLQAKREGRDVEPLRVVSTQLVEAGVDMDFPVVYRALAGLDSIAQAAGRCNREGRLAEEGKKGRMVVFVPPEQAPAGHLRKAVQACINTLQGNTDNPLDPHLFATYFRHFYNAVDLDTKANNKKTIVENLTVEPKTLAVNFRSAAEAFRLIDNEDSATVVVRYAAHKEEIEKLLGMLEAKGAERWLMRKLQRYTITIPKRQADKMLVQGSLTLPLPGLYVQVDANNLYSDVFGLVGDDDLYNPSICCP